MMGGVGGGEMFYVGVKRMEEVGAVGLLWS